MSKPKDPKFTDRKRWWVAMPPQDRNPPTVGHPRIMARADKVNPYEQTIIAEICFVDVEDTNFSRDQVVALIDAAPELLEGFANMLLYIETYGGEVTANFAGTNNQNLDWYKRVLAKARGES